MCFGFNARGADGAKLLNTLFGRRFVPEHKINCGQLAGDLMRMSNMTETFAGTALL
jgi:hypothetical protein